MTNQQIDTGDTVKHHPAGETWIVACVQDEFLSWVGWPEGHAYLSDCELIRKATHEERQELLEQLAAINTNDHRAEYARRRLAGGDKIDAHEQWKTVKINSDVGEIVIAQFKEGQNADKCKLCGEVSLASYLLKDAVWAEAGLGRDDIAHATCVAHVLGRSLTPKDFPIAACNDLAVAMMSGAKPEDVWMRSREVEG